MNQSNLLIRNVLVTYGRMLLTVGLGLYTTRLLFQALSDEDIGIFSVLGASVALMEVVRAALTESAMRHLAICAGEGDEEKFSRVANTAYRLFGMVAAVIYAVGLLATPLVFLLSIPEDRVTAAVWVYQCSLLNMARTVLFAPVNATLVSRQAMVVQAMLALPNSLLMLMITAALFYLPGDRLVNYAILNLSVQALLSVVGAAVCFRLIPGSRPRLGVFERSMIRELIVFAGWTTLGGMLWTLRMRGSAIVLNLFFGPAVNASWEAANRIVGYMNKLVGAIAQAATPAIITAEGAGSRSSMVRLALVSCKYTGLIGSFFAAPIVLDADNILRVWFVSPPEGAVVFSQLLVASLALFGLTRGFGPAMQATNEIGDLIRAFAPLTILPVPVAAAGYWLGAPPEFVGQTILLVTVALAVGQARFVGKRLGFGVGEWAAAAVAPALLVAVIGGVAAWATRLAMPVGPPRIVAVFGAYAAAAAPATWVLAMTAGERTLFVRFARRAAESLVRRPAASRQGAPDHRQT